MTMGRWRSGRKRLRPNMRKRLRPNMRKRLRPNMRTKVNKPWGLAGKFRRVKRQEEG